MPRWCARWWAGVWDGLRKEGPVFTTQRYCDKEDGDALGDQDAAEKWFCRAAKLRGDELSMTKSVPCVPAALRIAAADGLWLADK